VPGHLRQKGFIGKTAEKPSDVKVSKLNCSDPRLNGERKTAKAGKLTTDPRGNYAAVEPNLSFT